MKTISYYKRKAKKLLEALKKFEEIENENWLWLYITLKLMEEDRKK